jgi:hypothetical protein
MIGQASSTRHAVRHLRTHACEDLYGTNGCRDNGSVQIKTIMPMYKDATAGLLLPTCRSAKI